MVAQVSQELQQEVNAKENGKLIFEVARLSTKNEALKDDLQFVERWANHHAANPNVSAQEALSCIQHYPSIRAITKSYKNGVIPATHNPYAEIEQLKLRVAELKKSRNYASMAANAEAQFADEFKAENIRLQNESTR